MKAVITIVAVLVFSSVTLEAQEMKKENECVPEELETDTSVLFDISPKIKEQLLFEKFKDTTLRWEIDKFNKGQFSADKANSEPILAPMPIAGSMRFNAFHNMPVAVPDSSAHYFIREKRIRIINPLENADSGFFETSVEVDKRD